MSDEFPFLSAEYAARPQPFWKNLRETDPVYYAQEYGFWVISKHEDILKMLKDPYTYSSAAGPGGGLGAGEGGVDPHHSVAAISEEALVLGFGAHGHAQTIPQSAAGGAEVLDQHALCPEGVEHRIRPTGGRPEQDEIRLARTGLNTGQAIERGEQLRAVTPNPPGLLVQRGLVLKCEQRARLGKHVDVVGQAHLVEFRQPLAAAGQHADTQAGQPRFGQSL